MSKQYDKYYQYKRTNKQTNEESWLRLVIDNDNDIYSYTWTNDPDMADRFETVETFYNVLEKYKINLGNIDCQKYFYDLDYNEDEIIDSKEVR